MVEIREVKTKADIKEFIEFPLRLYKDCTYFVPPLYGDEKKLLSGGTDTEVSESVFYLATREGETVGRIHGIIQKQYNELHSERRVRFTRFDSIDDTEVSEALFGAVCDWGRARGMDTLCGPLGFSDLDREGLLVEGFDEDSTFEEQYNYEYYGRLIESFGLEKEIDWLEFELRAPERRNEMLKRVADRALEMNKLHIVDSSKMSKRAYVNKYKDGFFDCIDECYGKLYGTVPFTDEMKDEIISQFMLIINKKYLFLICDEQERVVALGLCFPGFGKALQKSGGRLTPMALLRVLKDVRAPKVVDLGLVAVRPEYQSSGVNAAMVNGLCEMLLSGDVERLETNLNLETNDAVIAQWKHFTKRQHKRRRAYVKSI